MRYCRYCGMEGTNPRICEWCGRERPAAAREVSQPQVAEDDSGDIPVGFFVYDGARPDEAAIPIMPAALDEDSAVDIMLNFVMYSLAILLLGSSQLQWNFANPYVLAPVFLLFIAGAAMSAGRALPHFMRGWEEIGLPVFLMLSVVMPVFLVYIGYAAYVVITRTYDRLPLRLIAPHFGVFVIVVWVMMTMGGEAISIEGYSQFRGFELLGLAAVLMGWGAGSYWRSARA